MWIFSKTGFVSIVSHKDLPGNLLIRARVREDLEYFVQILHEVDGFSRDIQVTETADYGFRAVSSARTVAQAVARLAEGIDYVNFKNAVHGDSSRDVAYMKVWSAMRDLQEDKFAEE